MWRIQTENVINVCKHKFACTNVTPKRRNGAHFITHALYCAWVINEDKLENIPWLTRIMSSEIMRVDNKYITDINILNTSDNVQHDLRQVNNNHPRGKKVTQSNHRHSAVTLGPWQLIATSRVTQVNLARAKMNSVVVPRVLCLLYWFFSFMQIKHHWENVSQYRLNWVAKTGRGGSALF